jgi:hypothetical protein
MFFQRGPIKPPPPKPIIVKKPRPCTHLSGGKYNEYIERTETRSLGGVSVVLRSRVIRQVLPYKPFEPSSTVEAEAAALKRDVQASVPSDGNDTVSSTAWTAAEHAKVDAALRGFARWEVLFGQKLVRSTHCDRLTTNVEGICDACKKVAKDESLLAAINRVIFFVSLPELILTKCTEKSGGQSTSGNSARSSHSPREVLPETVS